MPTSKTAPDHALQRLYLDNHGWLRGWLWRKLGCPDSAADLAQDTFLRILNARETPVIREPRAFLTTIAKRVLANHYRRQDIERAYLETLASLPVDEVPSEESRAIILETLLELDRLLDGLPRLARQAFLLVQLDGLTYPEVAAQLGISLSSVKRYLAKAAQQCYFAELD
ncbi:sigma-70 family RNA polymerase sigma factor [Zestomonas carbonaria]|uniref:Putative RNA polymerase sigma factor FecI n=1 Tax=Zestomonas carbonaria TaxID=2762745 RepID=A0A7U7EMW3_9GAMM|nr:sigma-70 family RNA polymerase sigma factor [Pseudomonas carbonaria]CAD5107791.1 putative RNA polymerase sigma factor FecI [Pseudomonas carbonaria]